MTMTVDDVLLVMTTFFYDAFFFDDDDDFFILPFLTMVMTLFPMLPFCLDGDGFW